MAKKWLVLRTNHGFKGRMWLEGQVVEFADDVTPPHHFELITAKTKIVTEESSVVTPVALSQMQVNKNKPTTAATALKDQGVAHKPLTDAERAAIANLNETGAVSPNGELD